WYIQVAPGMYRKINIGVSDTPLHDLNWRAGSVRWATRRTWGIRIAGRAGRIGSRRGEADQCSHDSEEFAHDSSLRSCDRCPFRETRQTDLPFHQSKASPFLVHSICILADPSGGESFFSWPLASSRTMTNRPAP